MAPEPRPTAPRETVYAITSLTSASATTAGLGRLVREHWSAEAHNHVRDVTFGEDASASRTGHGPVTLATIRAAVTAALKDADYLHIPEGDATTPHPPKPSASTISIKDRYGHSRNTPEPCPGSPVR